MDLATFRAFIENILGVIRWERAEEFARYHALPFIWYTPDGVMLASTEKELQDTILASEKRLKQSGIVRVEFDILEMTEARFGRQRATVLFKDFNSDGRIIRLATTRFFVAEIEGHWKVEMIEFAEELFRTG